MGKGKLKKFAELEEFSNVYQKPNGELFKGKWAKDIFKNDNDIVLELACGKGDYTLALAKQFPNKNFIGIDIKGSRLHVGARRALKQELDNVRFLRIFIDHLDEYFAKNEISDIWITFPDPYLKERKASKRLTSPKFLALYKPIVNPPGAVRLKTDSKPLFDYTLEVIEEQQLPTHQCIHNVYTEQHGNDLLTDIQTYYEKKHILDGRTIQYVEFGFGE